MDLGLERAGMECAWQVEIDPFCRKVLTKHWPDVPKYNDVKEVGRHNLESVDLIAGGFPCQDISVAGNQAGIAEGTRSGLWIEFHRIISELRPRFVLVENVAALLSNGMGRVLGDLAAIGYDAEWDCLSARDFGAPHLRERIFIIAYPNKERELQPQGVKQDKRGWIHYSTEAGVQPSDNRQERIQRVFKGEVSRVAGFSWCQDVRRVEDLRGRSDIPEPLFRGGRDGIPDWMDRVGSIGNAIVPPIAEWIGRQILLSRGPSNTTDLRG